MALIISQQETRRLKKIADIKSYVFNDYLKNLNNNQTKFVLDQFFQGDENKLNTLNISYSLPTFICETFANYVGNPQSPLNIKISNQVENYIWGGAGIFICTMENGKFSVRSGSPDGYIKNADGSEDLIHRYVEPDQTLGYKNYLLKQHYEKGVITNTLYDLGLNVTNTPFGASEEKFGLTGAVVPLDTLGATSGLSEQEVINLPDGVDSPIVVAQNRYDELGKYGRSDIEKVLTLIKSFEIQTINAQDQFLKHLRAKMAIPAGMANQQFLIKTDDSGKQFLDIKNAEAFFVEAGDQIPQYVMNTNPLIEKTFEFIDRMIIQASSVVAIPQEFIGVKSSGGAESAESREIRISNFLKKVSLIRKDFEDSLIKIHDIAIAWGVKGIDKNYLIEFGDVFPVNKLNQAQELATAVSGGFISKLHAIQKYQKLDEADALAELERINENNSDIELNQNVLP